MWVQVWVVPGYTILCVCAKTIVVKTMENDKARVYKTMKYNIPIYVFLIKHKCTHNNINTQQSEYVTYYKVIK